jgi:hypothetical protein
MEEKGRAYNIVKTFFREMDLLTPSQKFLCKIILSDSWVWVMAHPCEDSLAVRHSGLDERESDDRVATRTHPFNAAVAALIPLHINPLVCSTYHIQFALTLWKILSLPVCWYPWSCCCSLSSRQLG